MRRVTKAGISYSNEDLLHAMNAVKGGTMSKRGASAHFGVPRSTLTSKLKANVTTIQSRGPKRALSDSEEREIVKYMKLSAERCQPKPLVAIREAAKAIIDEFPRPNKFNVNSLPSTKWLRKFMGRYKELSHRRPEALPPASSCVTLEGIVGWWIRTDKLYKSNGFIDIMQDKSRIVNADEKAFNFNPKPKRVVQERGSREGYIAESGGSKISVTVMCSVSVLARLKSLY